jgi:hypothetical protein
LIGPFPDDLKVGALRDDLDILGKLTARIRHFGDPGYVLKPTDGGCENDVRTARSIGAH